MAAMSFLLDHVQTPGRPIGELPPSPVVAPVQAALRAAAGGLVPVAVPVVVAWILGAGGDATWAQAVRLSLGLWLLGHHTGLSITDGHVGLVPLGLLAVPLLATWFAGRRLGRRMDPRAERIAAGVTRARPAMLSWRCLGMFAAAYALIAVLASFAAGMPGLRPISAQAALGAAAVATCGGGLGAASYRFGSIRAGLRAVLRRTPTAVPPWVRAAAAAQALQLAVGAAVVGGLVAGHLTGITALHRALDPGTAGSAVLTLAQVLLVPNAVLWACAAMAGPGFAVGAGTSVTLASSHLGSLPAIPLLAALPAPGPLPAAARLLLAVPVLSGVAAGVLVLRATRDERLVVRAAHAAAAAALTGVVAAGLAWLSGGPAGPGRLADVGPFPVLVGGAVALEVGAGAVLTVLVVAGLPAVTDAVSGWWPPRLPTAAAAPPDDGRTPDGTPDGPDA